ncbi:MAG TPA: hypothetical protein VHO06_06985 [Polyangia bacterium]|nr:hypothetical protein [Polyangia bacterium]
MKRGRLLSRAGALALALLATGAARAQTALEEAAPPPVRPPVWELAAGVRATFIKSPGYDPFSTDDGLAQFSLTGTRALLRDRADRLALVAGVGLDAGGSSATARGAPSSLTLTRVSALAEGRYRPVARLYLFARLAPGLLHGTATIGDASSPSGSGLTAGFDAFSLDASAGGALCFGELGSVRLGAWLVADGGYGFATAQHLLLAPSLGADQSKSGTLDLGTLSPSGGFFRIALALSY